MPIDPHIAAMLKRCDQDEHTKLLAWGLLGDYRRKGLAIAKQHLSPPDAANELRKLREWLRTQLCDLLDPFTFDVAAESPAPSPAMDANTPKEGI